MTRISCECLFVLGFGLGARVLLQEEVASPDTRLRPARVQARGFVEGAQGIAEHGGLISAQVVNGPTHCDEISRTQTPVRVVVDVDEAVEALHGVIDLATAEEKLSQIHLCGERVWRSVVDCVTEGRLCSVQGSA